MRHRFLIDWNPRPMRQKTSILSNLVYIILMLVLYWILFSHVLHRYLTNIPKYMLANVISEFSYIDSFNIYIYIYIRNLMFSLFSKDNCCDKLRSPACRLFVPSRYLNQFWYIVNLTLRANFSEIIIKKRIFLFKRINMKIPSAN